MKKYIIYSLLIVIFVLALCKIVSCSRSYTAEKLFKETLNIEMPPDTRKVIFYWDEQRKGASGILWTWVQYTDELVSKLEKSIGKSEYEDLSKTVNGDYYNLVGRKENIVYMHSFYIEGVKHHIVVVTRYINFTLVYIVEG